MLPLSFSGRSGESALLLFPHPQILILHPGTLPPWPLLSWVPLPSICLLVLLSSATRWPPPTASPRRCTPTPSLLRHTTSHRSRHRHRSSATNIAAPFQTTSSATSSPAEHRASTTCMLIAYPQTLTRLKILEQVSSPPSDCPPRRLHSRESHPRLGDSSRETPPARFSGRAYGRVRRLGLCVSHLASERL